MNVSQAAKQADASPVSTEENQAAFSRFLVALDASEYADHALAQVLKLVPTVSDNNFIKFPLFYTFN